MPRISIALVCLATLLRNEVMGKLTGGFEWNNRQCTWTEGFVGKKSLNRLLIIQCKATPNLPSIFCQYKGNPHSCAWYNQNHQADFYRCLTNVLRGDTQNLCNPNTVVCDRCPDVVFEQYRHFPQRRRPALRRTLTTVMTDLEGSVYYNIVDNC